MKLVGYTGVSLGGLLDLGDFREELDGLSEAGKGLGKVFGERNVNLVFGSVINPELIEGLAVSDCTVEAMGKLVFFSVRLDRVGELDSRVKVAGLWERLF
jgi:hypothetical protein